MEKLQKISYFAWKVIRWILGTIIVFLIAYAANLAVLQGKDIPSTSFVSFVNWLVLPGINRIVALIVFLVLFIVTPLSYIFAKTELSKLSVSKLQSRYRQQLIERVRATWISGVLQHSLHGAALITLGLKEQQDAIANPWRLVFQQPDQPDHLLPIGTRVIDVYDEAGGELLILGEPGSGKTTLLLELTRDLLERAKLDDRLYIPVIFNLASWADTKPSLADWIVEELNTKYQVPLKIAKSWIIEDQILPLLDGLDEVRSTARSACVDSINVFRDKHLVPTVLCSRSTEYLDQTKRVALRNAVVVQSLTLRQIDAYISSAGDQLSAISVALHEDEIMQKLATSPLMLSVLTLTYHGKTTKDLQMEGSLELRRHQIFTNYVQRMLQRRRLSVLYSPQKTIHSLIWIAQVMKSYNQTLFSMDRLLLNWFPFQRTFKLMSILINTVLFGLLVGLLAEPYFGLLAGLLVGLRVGIFMGLLIWMGFDEEFMRKGEIFWNLLDSSVSHRNTLLNIRGTPFRNTGFEQEVGVLLAGAIMFGLTGIFFSGLILSIDIFVLLSRVIKGKSLLELRSSLFKQMIFVLLNGLVFGLVGGTFSGLLAMLLSIFFVCGLYRYLWYISDKMILRFLLWRTGIMPFRYEHFLEYVTDCILFRKVGNRYIFIHRLLLDHFASLDKESVKF